MTAWEPYNNLKRNNVSFGFSIEQLDNGGVQLILPDHLRPAQWILPCSPFGEALFNLRNKIEKVIQGKSQQEKDGTEAYRLDILPEQSKIWDFYDENDPPESWYIPTHTLLEIVEIYIRELTKSRTKYDDTRANEYGFDGVQKFREKFSQTGSEHYYGLCTFLHFWFPTSYIYTRSTQATTFGEVMDLIEASYRYTYERMRPPRQPKIHPMTPNQIRYVLQEYSDEELTRFFNYALEGKTDSLILLPEEAEALRKEGNPRWQRVFLEKIYDALQERSLI